MFAVLVFASVWAAPLPQSTAATRTALQTVDPALQGTALPVVTPIAVIARIGDVCDLQTSKCSPGLLCAAKPGSNAAVCQLMVKTPKLSMFGETCGSSAGSGCSDGLKCSSQDGVCIYSSSNVLLLVSQLGETCGGNAASASHCLPGLYCGTRPLADWDLHKDGSGVCENDSQIVSHYY